MAKETHIVFIYDTQPPQDDILRHVLYFYPIWVSEEQKTALCGQIIGSLQCMQHLFTKPIVMSLSNGKFVIHQHGNFFIVMGSDKNTSSSVLQLRVNNLLSLIQFFHNDLNFLQSHYKEELPRKLQGIIKDYFKMLSISEKILVQKQMFTTKGFDDIFIQALHVLECCRDYKHVLGGVISYRNKLITSQLPSSLTQILQLTDAGILCSAKSVLLSVKLPDEVMLYEVYISQKEYSKLLKDSLDSKIFDRLPEGLPKNDIDKSSNRERLSIYYAMKKEQSLLFTSVPEEPLSITENNPIPKIKKSRPKFLNLDNTTKNLGRNKKQSEPINNEIITCNTPFQEVKKIVHFNPLSICHMEDSENNSRVLNKTTKKSVCTEMLPNDSLQNLRHNYNTIGDPTFPKFKRDGKQMSYSYYLDSNLAKDQLTDQIKTKSSEELGKERLYAVDNTLPSKNNFIPDTLQSFNLFNRKFKGAKLSNNSTSVLSNINFNNKKSFSTANSRNGNDRQKCVLLRWDKCNVSVTILLTVDIYQNQDILPLLCEICMKNLNKLERKMRYNMELQNSREKKSYKFVSNAGMLWNGTNEDWRELLIFNEESRLLNITEIVIRSDDSMFYGYYYGPNKLFYNEVTSCNGGLPFPTDPMGVIQIKAKRRIEANYGLVLF